MADTDASSFMPGATKAGTIISLYPVHGLGVNFGESSICVGFNSFDQEHFSAHNDDDGDDDSDSHKSNYIHYLMGNRPLLDGNLEMTWSLWMSIPINP
jgi:hypothetical protein